MTTDQTLARRDAADGMAALRASDPARARTAFRQAIARGWPGANVWVMLSVAEAQLGNANARTEALQRALGIDPGDVRALLYMAEVYRERGDTTRAGELYTRALQSAAARAGDRQPGDVPAHLERAREFLGGQIAAPQTNPLEAHFEEDALGTAPDDRLFRQSLDILNGQARPYFQQPTRYFYPGLPQRQFHDRDAFDWVERLEAQTPAILDELQSVIARSPDFAPYVESQGREGALTDALSDNPDWGAFYLIKQGERIEENIAACPRTFEAVISVPDVCPPPGPSVLFSQLRPGAAIPPHHGMLNTRLICHLPLIIPEKCGFRVGNDTREWEPGKLFIFDDSIEHEAWNRSAERRFVLIFEIWRPELDARQRALVSKLYGLSQR